MPDRRTLRQRAGDEAEEAVARHLAELGWTILARNVRVGRLELDIVALEPTLPPTLVFVEVRSRAGPGFGAPEESVDPRKVERLYQAAWQVLSVGWLADGRRVPDGEWRVDLVTAVRERDHARWDVRRHIRGLRPS